jgi:hypothetical protein
MGCEGAVGATGPAGFGREAQAASEAAARPISASLATRWVSKLIQFLLKSTVKVHTSYARSTCDAVRKFTLHLTMASDCRTATSFHLSAERGMND